jgi:hypothetical protein
LPTLLWARRFRVLGGFALGAALLALLSWVLVGTAALIQYVSLLHAFGGIDLETPSAAKFVDLSAFIRQLFHVNLGPAPLLLALPLTYFLRRDPWLSTVPLTLLVNGHAGLYDVVLLVPILILVGIVGVGPWPLVAIFLTSFFTEPVAQFTGVQILTPVLAWLAWKVYAAVKTSSV